MFKSRRHRPNIVSVKILSNMDIIIENCNRQTHYVQKPI